MAGEVEVKVCGVTTVEDARASVEAGADAIGVNFWAGTPRRVDEATARAIAEAVGDRALMVAVFVDATLDRVRAVLEATGIAWAQLHGDEPPSMVQALLPTAYKALRVAGPDVVEAARAYPGEHLLLDASVPGMVGGTGRTFDWAIAAEVARERKLTLAGGLTPDNVADAVRQVRPHRVDVASGIESAPGRKDPQKVSAFVRSARSAAR